MVTKLKREGEPVTWVTYFRTYSRRTLFDLPKLCKVIDDAETIKKCDNHFSIQRIVFHTGAKMLIFDH